VLEIKLSVNLIDAIEVTCSTGNVIFTTIISENVLSYYCKNHTISRPVIVDN